MCFSRITFTQHHASPIACYKTHWAYKHVCTVIGPTKKFPKALASSHLEEGKAEFYYANDEHVLAVKYRATKDKSQKMEKVVHLVNDSLDLWIGYFAFQLKVI